MTRSPLLAATLACLAAACGDDAVGDTAYGGPFACGADHALASAVTTRPEGDAWLYWCTTAAERVADGAYTELDAAGATLVRGAFARGLADGLWRGFYVGGALRYEHHFRAGRACGTWRDLDPLGTESLHAYPPCGDDGGVDLRAPVGGDTGWDGVACPGVATLSVDGDDFGPGTRTRACLVGGVRSGPFGVWTDAAPAKKVIDGTYVDGHESGVFRVWDGDGVLRTSTTFAGGLLNGTRRSYDAAGWLVEAGDYADDARVGVWTTYDPGGVVRAETTFRADVEDGPAHTYFADGTPATDAVWVAGVRDGAFA
ncbi:MAG: hypothetical protein KC635_12570, partial [Myxococcales bacterium]|nr:hypothetical protein [Myxococcales bacterium]